MKSLLITPVFIILNLLIPNTVRAQAPRDTFDCYCQTYRAVDQICDTGWEITRNGCTSPGKIARPEVCQQAFQNSCDKNADGTCDATGNTDVYDVPCVDDKPTITLQRGDECDPNNIYQICENLTTCRESNLGTNLCLLIGVQTGNPCIDTRECVDWQIGHTYCDTTTQVCTFSDEPLITPIPDTYQYNLCNQVDPNFERRCTNCQNSGGVWTAFGCVITTQDNIVKTLVRVGLSLAGGFALLLIIFGAFTTSTAGANPQKVQLGREIITAAVVGLIFILFSAVILQLIGIQILQLPGL